MTNVYSTIYFDTEVKQYQNFNWSRAVPYRVEVSEESLNFKGDKDLWSKIFDHLGQEAINMRKVCSFFLHPEFQSYYERSPIELSLRCEGFSKALRDRHELLTNESLCSDAWYGYLSNDSELLLILKRMHRLTALPQLLFKTDLFDGKTWLPLVEDLFHLNTPFNCAYVLNQQYFPNLERLKLAFAPEFLNLDFITRLTHTKLKKLELKFCDKQPIDLNMFVHFLRALPFLESLTIHCDHNPLTGALDLEPNSLLNLGKLKTTGIHLTSEDLSNFLSAARHLRVLDITYELTIKGTFKQLEAGDFPHLEKVSITNTDLDLEDMLGLLNAAPRLKEFKWSPAGSAEVNQIVPPDASFPQIERVFLSPASQTTNGTVFWELVEKMPNLETLSMHNVQTMMNNIIEYRSAQAYSALRSLRLSDSHIPKAYFAALLNHAIHLEDLLIDGGHIELSYDALQEDSLKALESLWMQSVKITERELLGILTRAENLEDLIFRHSHLIRQKGSSLMLMSQSLLKLKLLESMESADKNDCFSQEQIITLLNAAPNLETLNVPDRYLFDLNIFDDGALHHLRNVAFLYKAVTPEERARIVEIIRRVAPNVLIDNVSG